MDDLFRDWLLAKEAERAAIEKRRIIEDAIIKLLAIDENVEGTTSSNTDSHSVKIQTRFNHKIDADELQNIALENGLDDYLRTLFRWKPEINVSAWKATDHKITDVLSRAVTTTPGRPSFTITQKTGEK